jgi:hypothetical protein
MTTEKIKSLRVERNKPDADVVKLLEDLLARAKSGQLRAIAFAYVRAGYHSSYGWSGASGDHIASHVLQSGLCTALTAFGMETDLLSSQGGLDDPEA